MTPNEVKILNIVEERGTVTKRKMAGILGFSTDYAGYLLECLGKDGYIEKESKDVYALLPKGVDALIKRLHFEEKKCEVDIATLSMRKERAKKEIKRLATRRKI